MCFGILDSNTESDKYIWPDKDKGQQNNLNTKRHFTVSSCRWTMVERSAFLATHSSAKYISRHYVCFLYPYLNVFFSSCVFHSNFRNCTQGIALMPQLVRVAVPFWGNWVFISIKIRMRIWQQHIFQKFQYISKNEMHSLE